MCSLKGPKHGGANIKVMDMMADISENVRDPEDDEELAAYLEKILDKETFDRRGKLQMSFEKNSKSKLGIRLINLTE